VPLISAALNWSNQEAALAHFAAIQHPETLRRHAPSHNTTPATPQNVLEHALDRPSVFVKFGDEHSVLRTEWLNLRICADARIDNREELCWQLKGAPYLSYDSSDDIIILAAYARWGHACAEHLIGDFAFVIFDERHQTLYAACDGMNMRPLHYAQSVLGLCLATDAAQLLKLPFVSSDLNELALGLWISGYPDPCLPMYADIARLRPGHSLTATREGIHTQQFWDIDPDQRVRYGNRGEYAQHFESLLSRAVSDRAGKGSNTVAAQLSGGMDSTSVVALAAKAGRDNGRHTTAISHRYADGSAQDEAAMIERVLGHVNVAEHHYVDAGRHLDLSYAALYPAHTDSPGTLLSPRYHDDLAIAATAGE
jgi:asparagine synthase (glutamine-hydrolysing)